MNRVDKYKETKRLWYIKNKSKIRKKHQEYRDANREAIRAQNRDYYKRKRKKSLAKSKKWIEENKDRYSCVKKAYRESGRQAVKNKEYYESKLQNERKQSAQKLEDRYIKTVLIGNGILNPSREQIKQKRLSIKIKRIIHEKERAIRSQRNNVSTK